MKQQWQCEICGTIYPQQWQAELCETSEVLPARFKVGDTIGFTTRYDGTQYAMVKAVRVGPTYMPDALMSWPSKEEFQKRIGELNGPERRFHEVVYEVEGYWQMGKDHWTSYISEEAVERANVGN